MMASGKVGVDALASLSFADERNNRNDMRQYHQGISGDSLSSPPSMSGFEHHSRRHLPPPPTGTEWYYEVRSRKWELKPLTQAEVTATAIVMNDDHDIPGIQASPCRDSSQVAPVLFQHQIQDTDTFAGICLKYGVTATQLRRANGGFNGTNLSLMPNPLQIPNIRRAVPEQENRDEESLVKSFKVAGRHLELTHVEIRCYLALNDWDVLSALRNAEADLYLKDTMDPNGERARFDTPIEQVVIDQELEEDK